MVSETGQLSAPTNALGRFTRTEIWQQPELWPTTVEIVSRSQLSDLLVERPVVLTGAGTSAYAAEAVAASWPGAQAIPTTDLLSASAEEIEAQSPKFLRTGLLISLARSGDSPESLAVVSRIKRLAPAVDHLAITCNGEGKLAQTSGVRAIVLDPRTNDKSLAMTSSFSNLVLAGLCLCHSADLQRAMPDVGHGVASRLSELDNLASKLSLKAPPRVVVLTCASMRALAWEASLKILEMTAGRIPTLSETFLGLRHGPMSFVTPETLVLCFFSASAERRKYEEDLVRELRRKQLGYLVGIAPNGSDTSCLDAFVPAAAGELPDALRVPFEIPFAQLLAYHLSLSQRLDPDNPSPLGAITRVVAPFTIHDEHSSV